MAAVRRTHLPQDVNLFADALDAAMPGALPELVSDSLHEFTSPDRQTLRPLRLPVLLTC